MNKIVFIISFVLLFFPTKSFSRNYVTYKDLVNLIISNLSYIEVQEIVKPSKLALRKVTRELITTKKYIEDKEENWKSFEEVEKDGGGDCEDLTTWILGRLIQLGIPKENLGLQIYRIEGMSFAHMEPLIFLKGKVYTIDRIYGLIKVRNRMIFQINNLKYIILVKGINNSRMIYVNSPIKLNIYKRLLKGD